MNGKLEPEFRQRLLHNPDERVCVIVGVRGDLAERAEEMARRGWQVYRRLGIIAALAAEATGRHTLALCEESWVSWVEEDREVRALK